VAGKNPPGVGINDEDGMVPGVEKDGVSRLGSDAVQVQQLLAKLVRGLGKQPVE